MNLEQAIGIIHQGTKKYQAFEFLEEALQVAAQAPVLAKQAEDKLKETNAQIAKVESQLRVLENTLSIEEERVANAIKEHRVKESASKEAMEEYVKAIEARRTALEADDEAKRKEAQEAYLAFVASFEEQKSKMVMEHDTQISYLKNQIKVYNTKLAEAEAAYEEFLNKVR